MHLQNENRQVSGFLFDRTSQIPVRPHWYIYLIQYKLYFDMYENLKLAINF